MRLFLNYLAPAVFKNHNPDPTFLVVQIFSSFFSLSSKSDYLLREIQGFFAHISNRQDPDPHFFLLDPGPERTLKGQILFFFFIYHALN